MLYPYGGNGRLNHYGYMMAQSEGALAWFRDVPLVVFLAAHDIVLENMHDPLVMLWPQRLTKNKVSFELRVLYVENSVVVFLQFLHRHLGHIYFQPVGEQYFELLRPYVACPMVYLFLVLFQVLRLRAQVIPVVLE